MHGQAPLSPFTSVPGWESVPEQQLLLDIAAQVPENGVIVEIGGEFGMSASLFCKGAHRSVKVYTIDLFPGDLLDAHRSNMQEAGFVNWPIVANSQDAAQDWQGEIDLLFIDGDHSFEGVLADLNNWTPFVKQGGVVILHDVACETNKLPHPLHYEVKRALDAWRAKNLDDWMFIKSVDSTVVLERVGDEVAELGKDDERPYFKNGEGWIDGPDAPIEPEPEIFDDLDAEVHEAVDSTLALRRVGGSEETEPVQTPPSGKEETRFFDNPPEVAIRAEDVAARINRLKDDESYAAKAKPRSRQGRGKGRKTSK